MKRFFFAGIALALGSTLLARAQDAATQQRLDELRDEISVLKAKLGESQRWLVGTMISSAGLFIAAVGLLLKVMAK